MPFGKSIAGQLSNPSGLIGRWILPRLWNQRNRALNDLTLQLLELKSEDRVLEVGFGGGYLLGRISLIVDKGLVAGVDPSHELVAFCSNRYQKQVQAHKMALKTGSAGELPFEAVSFTKACTVNAIFYFPDLSLAFSELHRVLIKGGLIVVCFTKKEYLQKREFSQYGLKLYEISEVRELIKSAGFQEPSIISSRDRHREFACAVSIK